MTPSHSNSHILRRITTRLMTFAFLTPALMAQSLPSPAPELTPLPHPDLPKPVFTEPGLPLWMVVSGASAALVLAALVIWMLLHRGRAAARPPALPLARATERLNQLLAECPNIPPDEIAHRVSVIVRDYQKTRYAVPAPFRTREELYEKGAFTENETLRTRFEPLAEFCDRLAFAPAPSTTMQAETLIQTALDALSQESKTAPVPAVN